MHNIEARPIAIDGVVWFALATFLQKRASGSKCCLEADLHRPQEPC